MKTTARRRKRPAVGVLTGLLALLVLLAVPAAALTVPEPSELFYVADYANVLENDTIDYMVERNDLLYDQTGAQIVVLTVDFLDGAEIEDYAYAVFNDWGIGSADKNNGVLLLLVIGPPMEEKYGSKPLLCGMVFTALVTGVLQCVLFPRSGLLGASGIVFMLIMLSSLAGFSGGIPVTMLLVAALYLGQQVYDIIFAHDNVANFMHIVGGVCGTAFGYVYAMLPRKRRRPAARKKR